MVPAREKPQTLFASASQLFLKTDISPRQAQEKHNKISSKMAFITQAWRMSRDQTTLHGDFHRGNLFYHKPTLDSKGVLAVEDIVAIDWCGKRRRLFPRVPSIQNDLVTRTGSGQASRRLLKKKESVSFLQGHVRCRPCGARARLLFQHVL
jgi:predicted unusual protein kinase regulating ubiquinone biosynthesis (AarF/ABC1/UbiB family)